MGYAILFPLKGPGGNLDTARDANTMLPVTAEVLWTKDYVDREGFICEGCTLQVFPASYDRSVNRKRPYFRIGPGETHKGECWVPGKGAVVAEARKHSVRGADGFPMPFPNKLVLDESRGAVADAESTMANPAQGRVSSTGGTKGAAKGHHGHTARTIRPVCKAFCNMPFDRDVLPLRIPGVDGSTYGQIFRHAKAALRRSGDARALYYGPIRWAAKPVIIDDGCELTLNTGEWSEEKRSFTSLMRVRLDWKAWTPAQQRAIVRDYEVAQEDAREEANSGGKKKGLLFFVGTVDASDRALFHTSEFRMVCCLTDELVVPDRTDAKAARG